MTAVGVEVVALVALVATGWLLLPTADGPAWRAAAALPVGIAAQAVVGMVLLATTLPIARPWVALLAALGLAGASSVWRGDAAPVAAPGDEPVAAAGGDRRVPRRVLRVGVPAVVALVAVTAAVPLVNVTSDSFRYLTVARLLAADGDASAMSAFLLQTRSLVTGLLHGLAAEPGYLRTVDPLLAAAGIGLLWQLVRAHTAVLGAQTATWLAGGAAALVATNHQWVFHAFYVNGHLLFAVWLLLLVADGWRRVRAAAPVAVVARDAWGPAGTSGPIPTTAAGTDVGGPRAAPGALVASLCAAGLVLLRPEGMLVVGLALTPVVLLPAVDRGWRRAVLVATGVVAVVWHAVVLVPLAVRDDYGPPASMTGLAVLGVLLVGAGLALPLVDRVVDRFGHVRALLGAQAALWFAVLVLAPGRPEVLRSSIGATFRNVVADGAWGSSLLVLAGLLVVAVGTRRVRDEQVWLFPLLSFAPLALLLPFLRGGPYRVGPGDSLNRMLLHVLPLAVLALAMAATGEPRRRAAPEAPTSGRDGDQHGGAVLAGVDRDG